MIKINKNEFEKIINLNENIGINSNNIPIFFNEKYTEIIVEYHDREYNEFYEIETKIIEELIKENKIELIYIDMKCTQIHEIIKKGDPRYKIND